MTIPKSLPPLPTPKTWPKYIPRKELNYHQPGDRPYRGRVFLANRKLTDDFVKTLGIRKGEVVLDAFGGIGNLTRSLLNGGKAKYGLDIDQKPADGNWPEWSRDDVDTDPEEKSENKDKDGHEPALVITSDPSFDILQKGLGIEEESRSPSDQTEVDYTKIEIYPSKHHPNLLLSNSSPYRWPTIPGILFHPVVQERMKISEKSFDEDELPNLTVVCQVPNSELGEQMISQWIGSVTGGEKEKYWLWRFGRVRLGILVDQGMYNRLMALPGHPMNGRLSILCSALYHRRPIGPYHHVPNIDKGGTRIDEVPITPKKKVNKGVGSGRPKKSKNVPKLEAQPEPEPLPTPWLIPSSPYPTENPDTWVNKRTITFPYDYYPPPTKAYENPNVPLPRPLILGVELIPRKESLVQWDQKDAWDFVLRGTFITEGQPLKQALTNLGFGTENLCPRIEAESSLDYHGNEYKGKAVSTEKIVRDLTVEEWARVVDVFYKWPFRPESLLLDVGGDLSKNSREIGYLD